MRKAGEINRTGEARRLTDKRRGSAFSGRVELQKCASDGDVSGLSIWTACTLTSDEQLKAFEKEP